MNTKGNSRGRPIIHLNKYRYDEALGKYIRKKYYKHPVITVVKLDPEQCLLTSCKSNGLYFQGAVGNCVYSTEPAGPGWCTVTRKGAGEAGHRGSNIRMSAAPS